MVYAGTTLLTSLACEKSLPSNVRLLNKATYLRKVSELLEHIKTLSNCESLCQELSTPDGTNGFYIEDYKDEAVINRDLIRTI